MKDYYNIKRVSSSSLSWFETSPMFFKMMLDKEIEEENGFIYEKGEMVHSFILEPHEFEKNYVFLDFETPKSQQQKDFCDHVARYKDKVKSDLLLRAYKEVYISKEKDEVLLEKAEKLANQYKDYIKSIKISTVKKVLSKNVEKKLYAIKDKLYNHKLARKLLFDVSFDNGENQLIWNEFPILWNHSNGIECKSMLDRLEIDKTHKTVWIVDLKTSSNYKEFNQKFFEYKYYRQLAFYKKAVEFYMTQQGMNPEEYKFECYIIAINMKEPTEVKVYSASEKTIETGGLEIDYLLNELKWNYDHDTWDYPRGYYESEGAMII